VSVIDTTNNKVKKTIPNVGNSPTAIAVSSDGGTAYVAYTGTPGAPGVSTINTTWDEVWGSPLPVGGNPTALAVSPDQKTLFVTYRGGTAGSSSGVSRINLETKTMTNIRVGPDPSAIVISPDGKYAYVANQGNGTITVINTETNITRTFRDVPDRPTQLAISQDGEHLYVVSQPALQLPRPKGTGTIAQWIKKAENVINSSTVSIIDAESGRIESKGFATYGMPTGFAISPALYNPVGYIASDNGTVSLVDLNPSRKIIDFIGYIGVGNIETGNETTDTPSGVAVTPDGRSLYITDSGDAKLWTVRNPLQTIPPTTDQA
jgi:YVTN family beta-propeller protein